SQDRIAKLANLPRRASIGDVFDINRGRQALRTDMHDRIEPGNAAIGPVDDVPDGVYRKIHEHSMVCDIRQSGARDDLPPASDYGCAHVLFLSLSLNLGGAVDQLDFQRHEFGLTASLDFFGEEAGIERLHSILRPPGTQIAKQ